MVDALLDWKRLLGKEAPASRTPDAAVVPSMKSLSCASALHKLLEASEQRFAVLWNGRGAALHYSLQQTM